MHHSLVFYGKHQQRFLRLYITLAGLTKLPLLGRLVRLVANSYARRGHSGYYLTIAEAEKIVDISKSVSLGACTCRKIYHHCDNPLASEIVLGDGASEIYSGRQGEIQEVSKEEAKGILREAYARRLTHSIMHCGDHYYAICSCCSCCCVPTRLRRDFGIGSALVRNPNIVRDFQEQLLD